MQQNGERRSQNCCEASKHATQLLHAIAKTYSSCVEQPIQQMFVALSAELGHELFSGDAIDAYVHSPPPETPTFVQIDDTYANWYEHKFGKKID